MPAKASAVFYVSGHGFGHATRARVLIEALHRRLPSLTLEVRTSAPSWLFAGAEAAAFVTALAPEFDPGMLQQNGLDIDLAASLAAHEELGLSWEARVDAEADHLRKRGPALVLGDIPAAAFAAASAAAVPSIAIGNFSWDWILSRYEASEPRWRAVVKRYAAAYAGAEELFRLPMACPSPAFKRVIDAPLLVRRPQLERGAARRVLGLHPDEERPVLLLSFGGFGGGDLDLLRSEDLRDFIFLGFGPRPRGLKTDWVSLTRRTPVPHVDIMAACDMIVTKPGYGSFAEAVAQKRRVLYIPREDFPESGVLTGWLHSHGVCSALKREDFVVGRWRGAIEALLEAPEAWAPVPLDGGEFIAKALAQRLET